MPPGIILEDDERLPRDKMRKITIAFDVDGTLRSNKTDTTVEPNRRIVELFNILATFKNVQLYVWSGGGAQYAAQFARTYGLPVSNSKCISKFGAPKMDICIDDIQETDLATFNLICREK